MDAFFWYGGAPDADVPAESQAFAAEFMNGLFGKNLLKPPQSPS